MEVSLGAHVTEAVVAAEAAAVAVVGPIGVEGRLDLSLQVVGGGEPGFRRVCPHLSIRTAGPKLGAARDTAAGCRRTTWRSFGPATTVSIAGTGTACSARPIPRSN